MKPIDLTPIQLEALEKLTSSNRIRRVPADLSKADRFIVQSRDALSELPSIKNAQLRYDGAYNAAHDVSEALMAAYGYRTATGPGQHVTLGEVLSILFDETPAKDAAEEYEGMRISRNQMRYIANPIGETTADAAVRCAEELLKQAQQFLR